MAYRLSDMAGDVVGLMDALGFESAHIAGNLHGWHDRAAGSHRSPGRACARLTSVMSSTSESRAFRVRYAGGPGGAVVSGPARARCLYRSERGQPAKSSPGTGFPFDEGARRELAGPCLRPGVRSRRESIRQMAAIVASGSRHEAVVESPAICPSLVDPRSEAIPWSPSREERLRHARFPGRALHAHRRHGPRSARGRRGRNGSRALAAHTQLAAEG